MNLLGRSESIFGYKLKSIIEMEDQEIPKEKFEAIRKMIASEESVVGIDAKKTHIIIIHKLMEIERRLTALENRSSRI